MQQNYNSANTKWFQSHLAFSSPLLRWLYETTSFFYFQISLFDVKLLNRLI